MWEFTTPHLQPFNQFASLSMAVQRPEGASTHVAVDTAVDMRLNITGIDQAGKRHVIEYNRQHARVLTWASGSRASARVSLLSLTSVQYSKLMLTVTMQGPVRDISAAAMTNVTAEFQLLTMNEHFTLFEVSFKYAFMTAAFLAWIGFLCSMSSVPRAAQSLEQHSAGWMLGALVLFNEPLFAAAVTAPSPTWAVISSFGQVFGFSVLLGYWLVLFDAARLLGEDRGRSSASLPTTAWFWVPKVMLVSFLGVALLAMQWLVVYSLSTDPAYDVWSEGSLGSTLAGFILFLAALYFVWMAVLAVLVVRVIRFTPPSQRLLFFLTLIAFIMTLAALFGGSFFGNVSGILFLSSYAGVNMYVLANAAVAWPDKLEPDFDALRRAEEREIGFTVQYSDRSEAEDHTEQEIGAVALSLAADQTEVELGTLDAEGGTFGIGEADSSDEEAEVTERNPPTPPHAEGSLHDGGSSERSGDGAASPDDGGDFEDLATPLGGQGDGEEGDHELLS